MVRIKNVCRGLIAFATMVVILMADATCSNGRPVPTTVIMNTKKGVPQLISNWNKSHVPRKVMMDTKKGVPPLISNWNTRPVPSTLTMNTKKAVPPLISNSNTRPVPSTVTMNTKKGVPPLISNVSRFDVLRNFKKGDTHSRLSDLKKFLASFGYLPHLGQDEMPPTSLFDDRLEAAVRLYQTNFNLSDTGILDQETLAILQVPRCGREDVRNGLSVMLPKPKGRLLNDNVSRLPTQTKRIISTHNRSGLPTETRTRLWTHNGSRLPTQLEGQQWKLIGRNIMWQSTRNLTYAFSNFAETAILSSHDIRSAVASAFQSWAAVVPIDFHETVDFESANIKIEFGAGDHGDGWPFDGRLGNLAHAFPPEDGRFHIDSAEVWTVSMAITDDRSAVDLETVALHEIGHLIGLDHSTVHSSVMFPVVETRKVQRHLTADDIEGATALYGCRSSWQEYDIPQHWCHAEWENHEGHQRLSKGHIIAVILARTAIIFTALCSLLLLCLLMKSFLWKSFRWRPLMVGFSVDDIPIRVYKNNETRGIPYPKSQPMRIYSTLWDADNWATRGGLEKIDWSKAPFYVSYKDFDTFPLPAIGLPLIHEPSHCLRRPSIMADRELGCHARYSKMVHGRRNRSRKKSYY